MNNRSEFLSILQSCDELEIERFQRSKNQLSEPGRRARVFDEFPDLLPDDEIHVLALELINVINPISSHFFENALTTITDSKFKRELNEWLIKIINIGKQNILDDNMRVRQDIRDFLQWDRSFDQRETVDIMMAYVSAIAQAVFANKSYKSFADLSSPYLLMAMVNHINEHYQKLIEKELAPKKEARMDGWHRRRTDHFTYFSKPASLQGEKPTHHFDEPAVESSEHELTACDPIHLSCPYFSFM